MVKGRVSKRNRKIEKVCMGRGVRGGLRRVKSTYTKVSDITDAIRTILPINFHFDCQILGQLLTKYMMSFLTHEFALCLYCTIVIIQVVSWCTSHLPFKGIIYTKKCFYLFLILFVVEVVIIRSYYICSFNVIYLFNLEQNSVKTYST